MNNKLIFCPICGGIQSINSQVCEHCKSVVIMKESLNNKQHYMQISEQRYNDVDCWYSVLFNEEIKILPSFDNNKRLINLSNEEHDRMLENIVYSNRQLNNAHQPKCPMCGSTNIHKISGVKRATHGLAFGLFSKTARSQWECGNCHNKW